MYLVQIEIVSMSKQGALTSGRHLGYTVVKEVTNALWELSFGTYRFCRSASECTK